MIMRTDEEIKEQVVRTFDAEEGKRRSIAGESYEAGVRAALDWVTGQVDDLPMEDE